MASVAVEPDPHQTAFGHRLREWQRRHNWSQRELGAATFFSREFVAMAEHGLRTPSATFVERVDAALDAAGELRAAFAYVQRDRERAARRGVGGRGLRRRGRITTAARRLRAATASMRSPDCWAALDELHDVLRRSIYVDVCRGWLRRCCRRDGSVEPGVVSARRCAVRAGTTSGLCT